jgi:hypothetical protein
METEEKVIEILRNHYQTCNGKPTPLKALKSHYGQGFKFENLGLGKYGTWIQQNTDKFRIEKSANEFLADVEIKISEEDLLLTVTEYFSKSEMYYHRKHVLGHIRKIYGEGSFDQFGYGTFPDFLDRHGLDMGIARREDFKNPSQYNTHKGRRI